MVDHPTAAVVAETGEIPDASSLSLSQKHRSDTDNGANAALPVLPLATTTRPINVATAPALDSTASTMKRTRPQWREAVAGACAGAFSRTLLAPVERVKLIKQLQGSQPAAAASNLAQLSALQVAHKIYREEGLLAFWRGNMPNVIRVSGASALHFTCMDYFKRAAVAPIVQRTLLSSSTRPSSTNASPLSTSDLERRRKIVTSFISGGLAGAAATTLLYPVEFVRTRLAMDLGRDKVKDDRPSGKGSSTTHNTNIKSRQYRGMIDVLRDILRSDGIFGLYQGYGIALVGGVVYRVALLGGYDAWKNDILHRKQDVQQSVPHYESSSSSLDLTWGERMMVAQTVSLVAGTLTYPFDSVRRRLMMEAGLLPSLRSYRNSIHCTAVIWSKEGLRGFYLGIGPNLVRSVGTALLLVGYDRIRTLL